jgi:hypothetical protein
VPTPPNQCPAGTSADECRALAEAIESSSSSPTPTNGCPAALSEAECRVLGEAYEAAAK